MSCIPRWVFLAGSKGRRDPPNGLHWSVPFLLMGLGDFKFNVNFKFNVFLSEESMSPCSLILLCSTV